MSRREAHFDAMLRRLGAAYYQTLQEEAAATEVARRDRGINADRDGLGGAPEAGRGLRRRGQWRVSDVMTADVVTADRNMSYKQTAKLMTDQRVSAIPVVAKGGRVVGVNRDRRGRHQLSGGAGPGLGPVPAHPAGQAAAPPPRPPFSLAEHVCL